MRVTTVKHSLVLPFDSNILVEAGKRERIQEEEDCRKQWIPMSTWKGKMARRRLPFSFFSERKAFFATKRTTC